MDDNVNADVSDNEFDKLMSEIHDDQNQAKQQVIGHKKNSANWTEIMDALKAKNTNFIKNLISSKEIGGNAQHPDNGRTLLMMAVIIGNMDLVKGTLLPSYQTDYMFCHPIRSHMQWRS